MIVRDTILEALTFDDLLLVPAESKVFPRDVSLVTKLTPEIKLNIPLASAAMDTVTEARTAIVMAQEGGIGIIHRNVTIENQIAEVIKVKRYESFTISDPITLEPVQVLHDAFVLMKKHAISGFPVVKNGKLVGILTNRDLRFERNLQRKVSEVMTKNPVTARPGITLGEAEDILNKHKIEKLPVVDGEGNLKGLITVKDIEKTIKYPLATKDSQGRLRVGAAMGVGKDYMQRAEALIKAEADCLVVDTAHGHTRSVIDVVKGIKRRFPGCQLIAGNIATREAADALIKAGADALKIGMGPGSICTTRVIAGVGVPQMTAIFEVANATSKRKTPLIADGGIKFSGDITKALAAGAHVVMVGNLFAGTDESPGETVLFQGRPWKVYRGMGSQEAMKSVGGERYFQFQEEADEVKFVPEGIEGRVPYRGPLSAIIYQLIGGLKAGMGYTGCRTIPELHTKSKFVRVTNAGLRESHVHDVIITREAPNYRLE